MFVAVQNTGVTRILDIPRHVFETPWEWLTIEETRLAEF